MDESKQRIFKEGMHKFSENVGAISELGGRRMA
jgi:hypothetical protein